MSGKTVHSLLSPDIENPAATAIFFLSELENHITKQHVNVSKVMI